MSEQDDGRLSDEDRSKIEAMTIHEMLSHWRFDPAGTYWFRGERGALFQEVMFRKRDANPAEWTRSSKALGWR